MPEGTTEHAELLERLDVLSDLVEENNKIAHDTNRIVRDMRRTGRIAFWFKLLLWIVVLGLPFFIGPLLKYFSAATGFDIPANSSVFGIPSSEDLQKAISTYKAKNTVSQ
jgi:hypothetical protein